MQSYGSREQVERLYELLRSRHYPEVFCREVCKYMNTEYTAGRMLGYLSHYDETLPMEVIADELVTILSDRNRFIKKAETEKANASYNEFLYRRRMGEYDDDNE